MKRLLWREFALIGLTIVTAAVAFPGQGVLAEDNLSFVDAPGSPIPVKDAWYGAIGDFNEDGHQDIAVLAGRTIRLLLGNGDGTFASAGFSRTGIDPIGIVVGDFNEDGNLDVAVACDLGDEVSILLGDGKGGFRKNRPIKLSLNTQPARIVAADFNGDGHLDLATANYGAGEEPSVSVFLGDGKGNFAKGHFYRIVKSPDALAVADFNEDGYLDIVATNLAKEVEPWVFKGYVSFLYGDGTGGFAGPTNVDTGITDPYRMAVADFNGDGHLDLAMGSDSGYEVSLLLGDGKGGFHPCSGSPFLYGREGLSPGFFWIGAADFDEDGHVDLSIFKAFDEVLIKLNIIGK